MWCDSSGEEAVGTVRGSGCADVSRLRLPLGIFAVAPRDGPPSKHV